jgi:hypothetical protein
MTIRSSASPQRWTNREKLDKEQNSRNNDSCHKGEQTDRFPARILPTHYEARTRRYGKCCGGKENPYGKRVGSRLCLRRLWSLEFWSIQLSPIRLSQVGWSSLSRRKVKRPFLMQL